MMEQQLYLYRGRPFQVRLKRLSFDMTLGLFYWVNGRRPSISRAWTRYSDAFQSIRRALMLLFVTSLSAALAYYMMPFAINWLFSLGFAKESVQRFDWRAFLPVLFAMFTSPVLYLLWYFRDRNVSDKLSSDIKDVSLKEFNEVQARAAGLVSTDESNADARATLQRASIHQLSDFLAGRSGPSFQRPALETLMAVAEKFNDASGGKALERKYQRIFEIYGRRRNGGRKPETAIKNLRFVYQKNFMKRNRADLDADQRAPIRIISSHIKYINGKFSITNRSFFRIYVVGISNLQLFISCNFTRSSFQKISHPISLFSKFYGCDFSSCDFSYSNLYSNFLACIFWNVKFVRANLSAAKFLRCQFAENADFRFAVADNADFSGSNCRNSDFRGASLTDAKFDGASLDGADFRGSDLRGIDPTKIGSLRGAKFDEQTLFCRHIDRDDQLTEIDIEGVKADWLRLAAPECVLISL